MANGADFSRAAALGFESGRKAGQINPLGEFISGVTKKFQDAQATEQKFGQELAKLKATEMFKAEFNPKTPTRFSPKERAIEALGQGQTLPGMSIAETKRVAGGFVDPLEQLINESINLRTTDPNINVVPPAGPKTPIAPDTPRITKRVRNKATGEVSTIEFKDGRWQTVR